MAFRDIAVLGASAGGISALLEMAGSLAGYGGSLLIVVHTSLESPGVLPSLLGNASGLPAVFGQDGARIAPGHIYIARPDRHLLVKDRRLELTHGPRENGFRPAADPLFRTAARYFGKRVVGVVLSGGLDDGTDGLRVIKELGGKAIAQDPSEAICRSMPESAIRSVAMDHIAPVREIAQLLRQYASEKVSEDVPMVSHIPQRPDIAENGDWALRTDGALGPPSMLTCPDCGGALWEFSAGKQLRYRCHVGHLYTGDGLKGLMDENLEQALWSAVRTMEEAAALRLRMAKMAERGSWTNIAPPYRREAEELQARSETIRKLLGRHWPGEKIPGSDGQNGNGSDGAALRVRAPRATARKRRKSSS